MSNDYKSWIEVHDGGKLTPEEVDIAVYGKEALIGADDYYRAYLEKSGRISIRTKYVPPVSAIAALALKKHLKVTMEFDSLDDSRVGSLRFFIKAHALEEGVTVADYYPQESVTR